MNYKPITKLSVESYLANTSTIDNLLDIKQRELLEKHNAAIEQHLKGLIFGIVMSEIIDTTITGYNPADIAMRIQHKIIELFTSKVIVGPDIQIEPNEDDT